MDVSLPWHPSCHGNQNKEKDLARVWSWWRKWNPREQRCPHLEQDQLDKRHKQKCQMLIAPCSSCHHFLICMQHIPSLLATWQHFVNWINYIIFCNTENKDQILVCLIRKGDCDMDLTYISLSLNLSYESPLKKTNYI